MLLQDFVGQDKVKENLKLLIDAAKNGREFPHIGLYGPPGCGKTTLAEIIAVELGAELIYINGSAITSPVVFRQPIAKAVAEKGKNKHFIVMIDECHAVPKKIQNNLLSVLEKPAILCTAVERKIKLPNGRFLQRGQILKEKLPDNVSFICCTTDKGQMSDAMESRLHPLYLEEYSVVDKQEVVKNVLGRHKIVLETSDYNLVAHTSKSMRHLVKICERLIDYSFGNNHMELAHKDVAKVLDILGIDANGCDINDKKYLEYVKRHAPVSLSNISRFLNVVEKEVKEKIEPYLIRNEWITITPKGRMLTTTGFQQIFNQNKPQEIDELMDIIGDALN